MNWFLVSLVAPLMFSFVNHAEKIILSRFFHGGGSGGLMIFIGVVAVPIAVLIKFATGFVDIGFTNISILVLSGIMFSLASYLYLKTLENHDASYVVPFWQLTPILAFILQ